MPVDMKEVIAQAAMKLLIEKHAKKLTVKDIVEECHITRQTFYYHFADIPEKADGQFCRIVKLFYNPAFLSRQNGRSDSGRVRHSAVECRQTQWKGEIKRGA